MPQPPSPCRVLWACSLLFSGAAQAQFGAGVAVDSDYRVRGVSLSDGKPDLRVSLAYDHPSGAYAGASLTRVDFAYTRDRHSAQVLGYAGYVTRAEQGRSWELGLSASHYGGDSQYDYAEVFAGLLTERWTLRGYYSPDYFGRGQPTVYAEFDGNFALAPQWRLFGHVGALAALRSIDGDDARRTRVDVRLGLGVTATATAFDVQLAWIDVGRGGPAIAEYGTRRVGWVLSASVSF